MFSKLINFLSIACIIIFFGCGSRDLDVIQGRSTQETAGDEQVLDENLASDSLIDPNEEVIDEADDEEVSPDSDLLVKLQVVDPDSIISARVDIIEENGSDIPIRSATFEGNFTDQSVPLPRDKNLIAKIVLICKNNDKVAILLEITVTVKDDLELLRFFSLCGDREKSDEVPSIEEVRTEKKEKKDKPENTSSVGNADDSKDDHTKEKKDNPGKTGEGNGNADQPKEKQRVKIPMQEIKREPVVSQATLNTDTKIKVDEATNTQREPQKTDSTNVKPKEPDNTKKPRIVEKPSKQPKTPARSTKK